MSWDWSIPADYTVDELIDMAKEGWESVLGNYLGEFTWLIAIISSLVLIGLAIGVGAVAKNQYVTAGLIIAGLPTLVFTWWQFYYAVLDGLAWMYVILAIVAVATVWKVSPYALIAVGLGTFALTMLYWFFPEYFAVLAIVPVVL